MTDRVNSLTIVLERDVRDDDVESLVQAIKHFKGVLSVDRNVTDISDHVAATRERHRVNDALFKIIQEGI